MSLGFIVCVKNQIANLLALDAIYCLCYILSFVFILFLQLINYVMQHSYKIRLSIDTGSNMPTLKLYKLNF